jgi:hypothetical protein
MGKSKLCVWFRDEKCKPFPNLNNVEGWDWVSVWDCSGNLVVDKATVPISEHAHVDIDIPPGCYVVQGHVCGENTKPRINDYTSKAIVMVGCNEVKCVNLIVPQAKTCAREFLQPLIAEALLHDIPRLEIQTSIRTITQAIGIQREELIYETEKQIEHYSAIPIAKNAYVKTKEILMDVPIPVSKK